MADGSKKQVVVGVRENRLSGLLIHLMVAASVFLLDYFGYIPMAVLFGLFLYMGLASLGGNQFFERLMLWITDPQLIPSTHYTRAVPLKSIHRFTLIQLSCFVALWLLKASPLGILFPLLIAALVPINLMVNRWFEPEHIKALLAEDQDDDKHLLE
jgi:hypothetical protein